MTNYRKILGVFLVLILMVSMVMPFGYGLEFKKNIIELSDVNEFKEGVVIVQFEANLSEKEKGKYKEELGLSLEKKGKKSGLELLKLNGKKNLKDVIDKLNKKKGVIFAEPDYVLYPTLVPNDTYYSTDYMWGMFDIEAGLAWDSQWGDDSIVVAVIDTGTQTDHVDLSDNMWNNIDEIPNNGIDDDNNGYIDDVEGWDFNSNNNSVFDSRRHDDHGTHVSGTIAAAGNNGKGVIGVAPGVTVMPLKFLGANGGSTFDAIEAIDYASDNGADIINASWGGGGFNQALKDAIESFDGVFVAAAGNDGVNTDEIKHYPSSYESINIISVAAIGPIEADDTDNKLGSFSNYGALSVDIAAPGVTIASSYPSNKYAYMSGTSMAAPHVSGLVALMLSKNPDLTPIEILTFLDLGGREIDDLVAKTTTGKTINANTTLGLVPNPTLVPVDNPPTVAITEPINNSNLSGLVLIKADASDDNEVEQVEFFVDGVSIGIDTISPYEKSWDTTTLLDGEVSIYSVARDKANQTTNSATVNVIIDNEPDPEPDQDPIALASDVELKYRDNLRKKTTTVQAIVTVTDGNATLVSGVLVDGYWVYPDGSTSQETGTTGDSGTVTFKISKVPIGEYQFITVTPPLN